MRVAIITLYPSDYERIAGGIRAVSYNLVEGLRRYPDLDLQVVHCHSDIAEDRLVRAGSVTVHYMAMPRQRLLPNLVTSVWRVRRLLRTLAPDVVHAHVGQYAWAAVTARYPTVYTIHGVLAREREVYSATLYDRLRYGLLAHYESRALPRVDRLVAISPHVREAYARVRNARWVHIDNPVPQAFFDLQRRPEPGRLLFAGSITEIKDLLTLLRAVERVRAAWPTVHLRIAGRSTSAAYEQQVRAYVAEHGLEDNVAFLGLVDRTQLLDEYARCGALVLSSLQENAPMAVIEAMAAGAPVVSTRAGGVPDLVRDGETGLLAPVGDAAALSAHLAALLRDPALGERLGANGRALARSRFHSNAIAAAYYALYQQVAAERARAT
jgi:glycosyltransferase involved in cell wall biosynthesis